MTGAVICLKGRQAELGRALELAPHVLYVGRAMHQGGWRLPKSAWANPFRAQRVGGADKAVEMYGEWLAKQPELLATLPALAGRTLACWCTADSPCHARLLAEVAADLCDPYAFGECGDDYGAEAVRRRVETVRIAGGVL